MRILLVSNYQPPHMGGVEFAAGSLKRCWEQDGHRVTWMTTDIPRSAQHPTEDNVRVPAANFLEDWLQVNSPLVYPQAYPEIIRQVRKHDVVNIHSLAPGLSLLTLFAALRRKWPCVVTQHVGVIPMQSGLLNLAQKMFLCRVARWAVKKGVPLTFVGQAVRAWFLTHAHIRSEQVFMTPAGIEQQVYHFVPDTERAVLRQKWKLSDERLNVLFVGRFYEKKGMPLMNVVASQCPDIRFTFVGSGPLNPISWNLPNIHVLPFVSTEELRELYGTHDLFIMPSVGEGWPAVVPQAMACGLACLISEETFAGYNQDPDLFLVTPREPGLLIEMLKSASLKNNPLLTQRNRLSEYAMRTWDWKRTAQIYLDLFNQALSRQHVRSDSP